MTVLKKIAKLLIDYYNIDVVKHALNALYIWVYVARKITKLIDFVLMLIMMLPESLIIPVEPKVVNKNGELIKIIQASCNGEVLTNKFKLYLRRYFDIEDMSFSAKKIQDFIDISQLMILYITVEDSLTMDAKSKVNQLILEIKEHVYRVNGDEQHEVPFGEVQLD